VVNKFLSLSLVKYVTTDHICDRRAFFGIDSVENLVANRPSRFVKIKRYDETDNYLCQMLR